MKDQALEEEEIQVGRIFIGEYNKLYKTDYDDPIPVDADADHDVIFASPTRSNKKLFVQITKATDESIERQISEDQNAGRSSFVKGNCPDEEVILVAIEKKSWKYADKNLILIIYTDIAASLPRSYQVPSHVGERFREIWLVELGKRLVRRISVHGSDP